MQIRQLGPIRVFVVEGGPKPYSTDPPWQLDGSGSTDPDGTPLAFSWRFTMIATQTLPRPAPE
jgi:hypothetical protein